ncbi:MAG: carboxypeptidase-like regulatory domain-containing protein [Omnitrophica bacterium]|nr:carboxypeptidase-like regulatory domain-containing protein [Candidatus Omnitrophota bacterium]
MLRLYSKKIKIAVIFVLAQAFLLMYTPNIFSDVIFLKQKEKGNNVEILEEGVDTFIVKIPKSEIESIKGEDYSNVKLWKEKKILWEDQGDYVTIFLPKQRIVAPDEGEQKEGMYYGKTRVDALKDALSSTGAEATLGESVPSGNKGYLVGRIFNGTSPAVGCKVKIVYIKGQMGVFSKLFGADASEESELAFESKTDENGTYEFNGVPVGSYDLYWLPSGRDAWLRKLSEKPSITVLPGKTIQYEDINLR